MPNDEVENLFVSWFSWKVHVNVKVIWCSKTVPHAFHRSRPQIRSCYVRVCDLNDWSNAKTFFLAVFLGMQHILPSFGRDQSSFGAKKPLTCIVQIFVSHSWVLGIIKDCHLVVGICLWSKPKKFSILWSNISRKNRDICEAPMRWQWFLLEIHPEYWRSQFAVSLQAATPWLRPRFLTSFNCLNKIR